MMSEFDKYMDEINKTGACGPKGDVGLKNSFDTHDYDYEFEESYDSKKSEDIDVENDSDFECDLDDFITVHDYERYQKKEQYDKQYDRLFATYPRDGKKSIAKKKSSTFSDDQIAGFEQVKNYYIANMEAKQKAKATQVKVATMVGFAVCAGFLFVAAASAFKLGTDAGNASYTYITQEGQITQNETLIEQSDLSNIRRKIQESNQTTMLQQDPLKVEKTVAKIEPAPIPSVVNNYNFDQLNSGLATLGYSLLACFAAFVSFRGLSSFTKSFKLKREIKKSKVLIDNFNLAISTQDNQLAVSQLINDQIVINNILIDRLQNNNNVVELMAVNEKMKDASQFINNNLITNFKGV